MDSQISTQDKIKDILYRFQGGIEPENIDGHALRILEQVDKSTKEEKKQLHEKHETLLNQFVRMHEFEKHFLLAEALPPSFAAMSIKMTQTLIKEHNCISNTEKSLVEIIVNAFCRTLHLSRLLTMALSRESIPIEPNYVNYYNFLSKEHDKANRQYLTALTTLQQLKSPSLKVTLKAETAIVGQNQQFNSMNNPQDENNKTN